MLCNFSSPATLLAQQNSNGFIVSFTSFPARIEKVWLVVESILRQTLKPDRLILWLSTEDFEHKSLLPKKLLDFEKRGLEIRFIDDNLKPHKKYFYAMHEFPNATIITIDDDMIYPPDLLENLMEAHTVFPEAICCAITHEIAIKDGEILPYDIWNYVKQNANPSFKFLTMGGGGTLFPKNSLNKELFNIEVLREKALETDDLWLKIMSLLNKTKVLSIAGEYSRFFIPIMQKDNVNLMDSNIGLGRNDDVLFDLLNHYNLPISIFEDD